MTLPLILADQRLTERRGIKAAIFGKSGLGKTSLLWTLNPGTTLFFDLEAGDLAIEGWSGDTIRPRTWEECRDFAVFIGGPNPAIPDGRPYSQRHYNDAVAKYGDPGAIDKYASIFVPQIDGAKTGLELPGIVDEVLTMTEMADAANVLHRVFVCQTMNPWGYPAKDRSGRLDLVEEAHLGRLIARIAEPGRSPLERLTFSRPAPAAPDAEPTNPTTTNNS